MIAQTLGLVLNIIFPLFGALLLLRAWSYAIRLHPHNPYLQAILRLTDWLVRFLRKFIPTGRQIDAPSLLGGWLCAILYLQLNAWLLSAVVLSNADDLVSDAFAHIPMQLVLGLLTLATWACNLVIWGTIIQAILSWVNPLAPIMPVLHTLTAPLLNPIRRLMPNLGGLDFSPLVLIVLAQIIMGALRRLAFGGLSLL